MELKIGEDKIMRYLISIIVPVYKVELYLHKSVLYYMISPELCKLISLYHTFKHKNIRYM